MKPEEIAVERGTKAGDGAYWSQSNGLILRNGLVVVPDDFELRKKILRQHHDIQVAGHPGQAKTTESILRNYWWPRMHLMINKDIAGCLICQQTKIYPQEPTGEL